MHDESGHIPKGISAARAGLRYLAALTVIGAGVLAGGCAAGDPRLPEPAVSAVAQHRVPLRVTNRHWRDVEVFLLVGGAKRRLGRVDAMANADLTVPTPSAVCQVRLVVRAAGQPSLYTSPVASLYLGASLDLLVPSDPAGLVLTAW